MAQTNGTKLLLWKAERRFFAKKMLLYAKCLLHITKSVPKRGFFWKFWNTHIFGPTNSVFHLSVSPRNFALYFCYTAYRKQTKKQMNSFRLQAKTKQLYI